jgi:hypothetical protein
VTVYRGVTDCCSVLVVFRQRFDLPNSPSAVASLSFQSLDLSQKLGRECRFAPETLVTRIAPEAQVHIARSCFQGSPENA